MTNTFEQVCDGDKSNEYVNFKRVVWHESVRVLFETIYNHSRDGIWVDCGDKVRRWLFVFVGILSADYEEQYVIYMITPAD